jgi:hypothetical protein
MMLMPNLKPAPLFLTPQIVRGCLGIGEAKGMATLDVVDVVNVADAPREFRAKIGKVTMKIIKQECEAGLEPPLCSQGGGSSLPLPAAALATTNLQPAQQAEPKPKRDWITERRERLESAIAFLRSQAILVQVADKNAAVRMYRVSGSRTAQLAEEIIELAIEKGWSE